jgi:TolB-like protein
MTVQSSEAGPMELTPHPQPREKPGWMAIALLAAFVLAAVGMYLAGAHFIKRSVGDLSSLAVLPFTDLGDEPFGASFAQQLADELARVEGLRVFQPGGMAGRRIGAVVEGSVLRSGGQVRVKAQLVRLANRSPLWSHTYECGINDVARVRAEIVREIARTLSRENAGQIRQPG